MRAHQLRQKRRINFGCSKRIHEYAHRLSDANRVCELNLAAISQSRRDHILCHIARHVSSRAVYLGGIFAAKTAAPMATHPTVTIHDNFPARKSGIAHGAANHESSGWIDVIFGVRIKHVWRDSMLDHV